MKKQNNKQVRAVALVLGYNSLTDLKKSLPHLVAQTYENLDIVYIDNASSDDAVQYVQDLFPAIRVIQHKKNYGYAGAYAAAMREFFARGGYDVMIAINPDIVLESDCIEQMICSAVQDVHIGFVQPVILKKTTSHQKVINTIGNNIHISATGLPGCDGCAYDKEKYSHDREVSFASGAALLIKREVFEMGLNFDKDFFLYCEDQDFVWRGKMQGFKSVMSAKAFATHDYDFVTASTWKKKFFYLERNRLFFIYKNYSCKLLCILMPYFLLWEVLIVVHAILNGYFLQKIHAFMSFLSHLPTLHKKRIRTQKKRILTDAQLIRYISPRIDFHVYDGFIVRVVNVLSVLYYKVIIRIL